MLRGTDNVQGQISEHIFAPNGGYCVYYPSSFFRSTRSFENWGIFSDIPQFWLGNIHTFVFVNVRELISFYILIRACQNEGNHCETIPTKEN